MKTIRLVLFIPAFFLTLLIGNILFDLLIYFVNFFRSIEDSQLSFIWDFFLKSLALTYGSITIGILVYPFKNKLFPLIFFSLFYVVLFIFIFYVYSEFWNELNKLEESWKIFASQISAVVGIIAGISGFWYNYLKGEYDDID
jgi:hypothetical protein